MGRQIADLNQRGQHDMGNGANLWIYWLSEFLGAAVAAVLFLVVNQEKLSVAPRDRAQEQTNQSLRAV